MKNGEKLREKTEGKIDKIEKKYKKQNKFKKKTPFKKIQFRVGKEFFFRTLTVNPNTT